jgi:glycosyltransferase involved in cell wall biosynthesis
MTGVVQGKAIVATDLIPFQQLLQHGKNALLVSYGDKSELAHALLKLIDYPEERRVLAEAVADVGGRHCWASIGRETRRCYEAALTGTQYAIAHAK